MELKDVTETLTQIAEGIAEAQKRLKEAGSGAIVNTNMTETTDGHVVTGGRRKPVEWVEFDVAIFANEGTERHAGGGLTVASLFKAEAGGKSNQARVRNHESSSRYQ